MKKFSFVLLPILTFPAIGSLACDNKDKATKNPDNQDQSA